MYQNLFMCSSIDGLFKKNMDRHLGYFYLLAIVSSVAMNMCTYVLFIFSSFGYVSKSGIAGSYGNSTFNFLRNH